MSSASSPSRLNEVISSTPLTTKVFLSLCVVTYIYQLLFDPNLSTYTNCPRNILYLKEYYRIITSSFFHGGLMHLGMNMMAFYSIAGRSLEGPTTTTSTTLTLSRRGDRKYMGSLYLFLSIMWGILLTSFVYISIALILSFCFSYDDFMYQHSVGFSGVLFQLSVLEANKSHEESNRTRSIYGMIKVKSKYYPWALLIILQIIMPNISFLGHLSGIVVGTAQIHGVLDLFCIPSENYLRSFEEEVEEGEGGGSFMNMNNINNIISGYVKIPSHETFIRYSSLLEGQQNNNNNNNNWRNGLICSTFFGVLQLIRNILETLKFAVFGRQENNTNNNTIHNRSYDDENDDDIMQDVELQAVIQRSLL
eukprot:CAMPEP_0178974320 /NCGR_PEP_ID=MMETSP0789-20121207/22384_1 /TAXON_ID=3005 /ORGANISM="Rhizosolenia setigera, Strain CCMP 1694" /LENGTH=363 /DNA_ID=CAMNT_0020662627 /DNA_START=30 /DNA_END=1118 /DNA_ORIENTATION=+